MKHHFQNCKALIWPLILALTFLLAAPGRGWADRDGERAKQRQAFKAGMAVATRLLLDFQTSEEFSRFLEATAREVKDQNVAFTAGLSVGTQIALFAIIRDFQLQALELPEVTEAAVKALIGRIVLSHQDRIRPEVLQPLLSAFGPLSKDREGGANFRALARKLLEQRNFLLRAGVILDGNGADFSKVDFPTLTSVQKERLNALFKDPTSPLPFTDRYEAALFRKANGDEKDGIRRAILNGGHVYLPDDQGQTKRILPRDEYAREVKKTIEEFRQTVSAFREASREKRAGRWSVESYRQKYHLEASIAPDIALIHKARALRDLLHDQYGRDTTAYLRTIAQMEEAVAKNIDLEIAEINTAVQFATWSWTIPASMYIGSLFMTRAGIGFYTKEGSRILSPVLYGGGRLTVTAAAAKNAAWLAALPAIFSGAEVLGEEVIHGVATKQFNAADAFLNTLFSLREGTGFAATLPILLGTLSAGVSPVAIRIKEGGILVRQKTQGITRMLSHSSLQGIHGGFSILMGAAALEQGGLVARHYSDAQYEEMATAGLHAGINFGFSLYGARQLWKLPLSAVENIPPVSASESKKAFVEKNRVEVGEPLKKNVVVGVAKRRAALKSAIAQAENIANHAKVADWLGQHKGESLNREVDERLVREIIEEAKRLQARQQKLKEGLEAKLTGLKADQTTPQEITKLFKKVAKYRVDSLFTSRQDLLAKISPEDIFEILTIRFSYIFPKDNFHNDCPHHPVFGHTFRNFSDAQRLALAERSMECGAIPLWILSIPHEQRFEFLKKAAKKSPEAIPEVLPHQNLDEEVERFEIAKIVVEHAGNLEYIASQMRRFNLSPSLRLFIAKRVGARAIGTLSRHIRDFDLPEEARFDFALEAARQFGAQTFAHLENFSLSRHQRTQVIKTCFASDFLGTAEALLHQTIPDLLPFNDPQAALDFKRLFCMVWYNNPDYLPKYAHELPGPHALGSMLWDRVQSSEIILGLLRLGYRFDLEGKKLPSDSLELLLEGVGLPVSVQVLEKLSPHALKLFYEYVLEIEKNVGPRAFGNIKIASDVWQEKGISSFLSFIANLRDLLSLRENTQEAWADIVQKFQLKEQELTLESLRRKILQLGEEIRGDVQVIFALKSGIEFTQPQWESLRERWGSVEPITTLLARFRGYGEWRKEIPVLAKVFQAILMGQFEGFKFKGDPRNSADRAAAAKQLEPLLKIGKVKEWKLQRALLSVYEPVKNHAELDRKKLQAIREVIGTNLVPHAGIDERSAPYLAQKIVQHVLQAHRSPEQTVLEIREWLKTFVSGANEETEKKLILTSVIWLMRSEENLENVKKLNSFLTGASKAFQHRDQVMADLKTIAQLLRGDESSSRDPYLLLTTTFHNPRLLITVGNLVDTSSCQDYKIGSHVEALLGYVIDANVQGLASFVLKPKDFSGGQYSFLQKAALAGRVKAVHFDGERGIATFEIEQNGITQKIISEKLEKAHYRRIIKLGETLEERAGILAERAYFHPHPAIQAMEDAAQQILSEMGEALGAKVGAAISIAPSRNPLGVYSDKARGIKQDGYILEGEEGQK